MDTKITDIIRNDAESVVRRVNLEPLAGKRVLVTGASGLIGTYVLACLDVFGKCKSVVKMATQEPPLAHPARQFCSKWIWAANDLANPIHRHTDFDQDYLFFAAGYGQPDKFTSNPLTTIGVNTGGLTQCLSDLNDGGRALYVSSSEIYSGHPKPPYNENDVGTTSPQHPRGCYIEAKRCGEAICSAYNTTNTRNKVIAARVALAYGPGTKTNDGRVLNQFIRQAINDRHIIMLDAGMAVRTYCYITDTIEFLLNMWVHGRYEVYNCGGKSKVTIARLARLISEICDCQLTIPPTDFDPAAPAAVSLDMRLAEAEFSKNTYVSLEDGLRRTIEWQRILYGSV